MGTSTDGAAMPPWPRASLLGRLSESVRDSFLELGSDVAFQPGRRLIRQGEPGRTAYLLLGGCVKILGNEGAREPLLGVRVAGDLVGEMATLSSRTRAATVSACVPTRAKAIPGVELRAFLQRHSEVALEVAGMLSERLRWANDRRVDFAALDARTRICRVLLALADTYGRTVADGLDLGVPLTQEEIASLAGVRLTTAEKALRALSGDGVLRLGYRSIVLTAPQRLRIAARQPPPER